MICFLLFYKENELKIKKNSGYCMIELNVFIEFIKT